MPTLSELSLDVFIDGSFDVGPRSGGWAFVALEDGRQVHEARGNGLGDSNNSFEVLAALEAMIWIDASAPGRKVTLWTDSRHVVEGCTRWRAIWRNNGWKRFDPNPRNRRRAIPDMVLWQKLDTLLDRNPGVTIMWCKGHSDIAGNQQADLLARYR